MCKVFSLLIAFYKMFIILQTLLHVRLLYHTTADKINEFVLCHFMLVLGVVLGVSWLFSVYLSGSRWLGTPDQCALLRAHLTSFWIFLKASLWALGPFSSSEVSYFLPTQPPKFTAHPRYVVPWAGEFRWDILGSHCGEVIHYASPVLPEATVSSVFQEGGATDPIISSLM